MRRGVLPFAVNVRIAVDCMGGDHGIPVTVPAALSFLAGTPAYPCCWSDARAEIERALPGADKRVDVVHADEVVEMHDPPATALRSKRDSSMRVAINLIKEGRADVVVSAGNTGALMAISRFVLKTLDGIDRPAIAGLMPNQLGRVTTMLDLGANVDCSAGPSAAVRRPGHGPGRGSRGKGTAHRRPAEHRRGDDQGQRHRQAGRRTAACSSPLNFHGNVEGNDIFKGTTDVVVCDGFVGNVALKTVGGSGADAGRIRPRGIHPRPACHA